MDLLELLGAALLDEGLDLLTERPRVSFLIVELEEHSRGNVQRACQSFDLIRRRPFLASFDLTKIVGAYVHPFSYPFPNELRRFPSGADSPSKEFLELHCGRLTLLGDSRGVHTLTA